MASFETLLGGGQGDFANILMAYKITHKGHMSHSLNSLKGNI